MFTGSGYTHETGAEEELKIGFFFDHTTGLPVIPGSTVKGVLRSAFPKYSTDTQDPFIILDKENSEKKQKSSLIAALFGLDRNDPASVNALELSIFEGIDWAKTNNNRAKKERVLKVEYVSMRHRDVFFDAFISSEGQILETDVLTPHGSNPLKNPIPLPFLKVKPKVEFTFQFMLHETTLPNGKKITAEQKQSAFNILIEVFGIGAKTNVGYGQLK